jgi:hypothetical protein
MTIYLAIGLITAVLTVIIGWNFYVKEIKFWYAPLLFILVWVFWPFILVALLIAVVRK